MKIWRLSLVCLFGVFAACGGGSSDGTGGSGGGAVQGGHSGQVGVDGASAGGAAGSVAGLDGAVGEAVPVGGTGVDGAAIDAPIGNVDGAGDALPSGGEAASADVDPHGGAKRWIEFGHSFVKCTWFTADQGFCSEKQKSLPVTMNVATDLYQTANGGRTWTLVATIDGKNSGTASMSVYVLSPTEMWFTTGFMGFGFSGTLGHSEDGGATWQDLTDRAHRALADDPDAGPPLSAPFFDLVSVGGAIWLNTGSWSQYFAMSPDSGASWQRVLGPLNLADVQPPQFIATKSNLLLRYITRSWGIALYRLSGAVFLNTETAVPPASGTDHGDTWWQASPNAEAVTFVDRRAWPWWGYPFLVSATLDGGRTFQSVYAGASKAQSGCEGLRHALVVDGVASTAIFVSGVFLDAANSRFDEIRKSTDGGNTWTILHSEPDQWNHTSVALDPTGKVHALRHTSDYYGNEYNYDAQYVLE